MLDDLFEGSKHKRHIGHDRYDDHHAGYRHERHGHYNPLLEMAQRILHNKTILVAIVVTLLLFIAIGLWLIFTLLPYLGKIVDTAGKTLDQQGIKGILETIMPLLQKIWEGTGK